MERTVLTDEHLALLAQTGDKPAFEVLVSRYWERLLRYARRLLAGSSDAEDIVQDAFLKAFINIRSYRPSRRFSPWIYRVVHNTLLDHVKSLKRDPLPFFDPDVLFPHPVAPDRPDDDADRALIRKLLDRHLSDLDSKYREPLVLRYYDDLSYRDIGDVLRLPTGTVSVRIKRGLDQLRKHLPSTIV